MTHGLRKGMMVEVTVKKRRDRPDIPDWYRRRVGDYPNIETMGRYIVTLPPDWDGFRDGTIMRVLEEFNDSVFVALAYITWTRSDIVTDLNGSKVDEFDVLVDGKPCKKYVSKRIRVLDVIDREEGVFRVFGYVLNLRFTDPVVKVLDLYSGGRESGVSIETFDPVGSSEPV